MNLNLCTDPWLPVRMCSGACTHVSLENFFQQAREISDLVLAAHERISIMRLLICIAQRAIDGPADRDEWDDCLDDISLASVKYLEEWRHAFNLLGEDGAFLQVRGVEPYKVDSWKSMGELSLSSATGNNPTLFDNGAGSERNFSLAQIAIDLITFQNFAPGGTMGVAIWSGEKTGSVSPDKVPAAPCTTQSAIHQFVIGDNMLDTIWLNMCPKKQIESFRSGMGKPVWEQMPVAMNDVEAEKNATLSYLGRLVPVSRSIKISLDAQACIVARGFTYPVYDENKRLLYFESSMSFALREDDERAILGADLNRALWRNLPSILHRYARGRSNVLGLDENSMPDHYGIWVGALVYDQAKVLAGLDDYYAHLTKYHAGISAFDVQRKLMKYAEFGANAVLGTVKKYYDIIRPRQAHERKKTKEADAYSKLHKKVRDKAEFLYWSFLTAHKDLYIKAISVVGRDGEHGNVVLDEWLATICESARESYNQTVSCNGVRQLAAWARARVYLPTKYSLKKKQ